MLLVNSRSLKKHSEELEALVYRLESPPNIIVVTETWLDKTDKVFSYTMAGFNYVSKPRPSLGGDILFHCDNDVNIIQELNASINERLMLEKDKRYKK